MQTVDKPTHRCGHILDWILHRRNDDILRTIHVSHQLTSDHFTIVCNLDLFVPSPPPTFTCKRNLSSIDNCILMQDITQCLHSTVMFTAAQLDSVLRSLLDKHAPMNNCKVFDKKYAPWYDQFPIFLLCQRCLRKLCLLKYCKTQTAISC